MKKLLFLFLTIIFIGCGSDDNLLTETCHPEGVYYYVKNIERYNKLAKYKATTYEIYLLFQNNIEFVDSIGKYKVGDSLYVTFIKK